MLKANAQTHETRGYLLLTRPSIAPVDRGLNPAEARASDNQLQGCDQPIGDQFVADVERDDCTEPGHLRAGPLVIGIGCQPGIVDTGDRCMVLEPSGEHDGRSLLAGKAHRQSAQAPQGQVCLHRPGNGSLDRSLTDQLVSTVGIRHDHRAQQKVGVATQVLGGGVDDSRCTPGERLL